VIEMEDLGYSLIRQDQARERKKRR